ncbi:MAG: DUF1127 domain-containing protein [Methyloversatilis sp.]|jgi:uncharacterized protein YjiS (DUF1127 family)|nr:DUF1127 domain-containing protein [Methyloversatilis universalis]MCP4635885.1 DUF1127 domain-containing protein [Methyloversatilis sp.]
MSAQEWWCSLRRRVVEARSRRRARAELRAMDDLQLRDLGLGRSDIPSVLAGRFDEPVAPRVRIH